MKKPSQLRAKKHLSQNFLTDENVNQKDHQILRFRKEMTMS